MHSRGILSRLPCYKSVLAMCARIFCTSRKRTRDFHGRPLSGRFQRCAHSPTPPSTLALRLANRLHLLRLLYLSIMGIHFYSLLFDHKLVSSICGRTYDISNLLLLRCRWYSTLDRAHLLHSPNQANTIPYQGILAGRE